MTLGTVYQYKSRVVVRIRREIEQFDWESAGESEEIKSMVSRLIRATATNHD